MTFKEENTKTGDISCARISVESVDKSETNVHDILEPALHSSVDVATDSENVSICGNDRYDIRSIRSISTAATIALDVIKRRTKLSLQKRDKRGLSRKILVKGEASAATRVKRENRDTIKQSTGIWGWE